MNVVRASSKVDIACEGKHSGNTFKLYSIITKRLKYVQWITVLWINYFIFIEGELININFGKYRGKVHIHFFTFFIKNHPKNGKTPQH